MTTEPITAMKSSPSLGKYILTFSILLAGLSGCATMSKNECLVANWLQLGRADGAGGKLPDYIYQRANNCVKNGIQPNVTLWEAGRKEGLRNYCTLNNAEAIGRQGKSLSPVCGFLSNSAQQQLGQSHARGYKAFEYNQKIERLKSQIKENEKDIQEYINERERLLKEKRDFNSGLEYAQLSEKIKQLREQNIKLNTKLAKL